MVVVVTLLPWPVDSASVLRIVCPGGGRGRSPTQTIDAYMHAMNQLLAAVCQFFLCPSLTKPELCHHPNTIFLSPRTSEVGLVKSG